MLNNIISMDAARPECWYIEVNVSEGARISCFFDPKTLYWVDTLLDDLRTLEGLPNEVVDDILNAQADVLARVQRAEIRRQ